MAFLWFWVLTSHELGRHWCLSLRLIFHFEVSRHYFLRRFVDKYLCKLVLMKHHLIFPSPNLIQHDSLCIFEIKTVVLQIVHYSKYKYFPKALIKRCLFSSPPLLKLQCWLCKTVYFVSLQRRQARTILQVISSCFNWDPWKANFVKI